MGGEGEVDRSSDRSASQTEGPGDRECLIAYCVTEEQVFGWKS